MHTAPPSRPPPSRPRTVSSHGHAAASFDSSMLQKFPEPPGIERESQLKFGFVVEEMALASTQMPTCPIQCPLEIPATSRPSSKSSQSNNVDEAVLHAETQRVGRASRVSSLSRSERSASRKAVQSKHSHSSLAVDSCANTLAPSVRQTDISPSVPATPRVLAYRSLHQDATEHPNHDPTIAHVAFKPLPDVLSRATFSLALNNPPVRHRLYRFSQDRMCGELMEFLDQIDQHRRIIGESTEIMLKLDEEFLSPNADCHIDLSASANDDLRSDISLVTKETYPSIADMFTDAYKAVENAVYATVYADFVRSQLSVDATKALGTDRHRYQGLGDCFCLTDPKTADNPIVYASDGFIGVTGYDRREVIPRNCRFLQGSQTDKATVQRIKHAIRTEHESVEFLLNYKKNGEPFWNLLYCAPLLGPDGKVAFFLGGQVNCSSSLHGKADIMQVLAAKTSSTEASGEGVKSSSARRKPSVSARKGIIGGMRLLKYRQKAHVAHEPGAEPGLYRAEGELSVPARVERFYSAYSKYLVVEYATMSIKFSSTGVHEMLNTAETVQLRASEVNVFKFLKQNMLFKDKSDWKVRIEASLRHGQAISVALNLQTLRSAVFRGDEKFLTHWTPLKDAEASTKWVVVCLCPTIE